MPIRKSKFDRFSGPRRTTPVVDMNTDDMDQRMGFTRFEQGAPRIGWLVNLRETVVDVTPELPNGRAALDLYFLDEEGGTFKATVRFNPYFLLVCKPNAKVLVDEFLRSEYQDTLLSVEHQEREDLKVRNHLMGRRQAVLKLSFRNTSDMFTCRRSLNNIVANNKKEEQNSYGKDVDEDPDQTPLGNPRNFIVDVNEEDVPYGVRVFIDLDIRVGKWYKVAAYEGEITLDEQTEMVARPEPVVFAFDIEAAKEPLMFPDAENDQITMISYMVNGEGYLITNRAHVSKDIEPFSFTPKEEFPGDFDIFNEHTEKDMLVRFFEQVREHKPTVMVSFNGDFFDWPYIEKRALVNGLNMKDEIGFHNVGDDTYSSSYCCHLDAFAWVKRDSYLPQGSQNLKEVIKVKLGYRPHELHPEEMTPFARDKPQILAEYSVSDAVATYYLYQKYVHPFIFSLCTILPLKPDDVLRKGTGTLCEMLLMVQAYQKNILLPHKHRQDTKKWYNGHLIESETYSGGHVESLEPGVFRNDISYDFKLDSRTLQNLIDELEPALKYTIVNDAHTPLDQIENFSEVLASIKGQLESLRDQPVRKETPYIYHLDVASMYPNIMTTNRLQPDSIVDEKTCEQCDFHKPDKTCARKLTWKWRGEYYTAVGGEYGTVEEMVRKRQYPVESGRWVNGERETIMVDYEQLPMQRQHAIFRERVSEYSKRGHSKAKMVEEKEIEAIVCQRENPFYINTVRDFKDRRISYKRLQKQWKQKVEECESVLDKDEASKMVVLYDSMQLAHKVILNSFYGYVMRTGSRWYSAEMAGVTCYTGAKIIQEASDLVKGLGRPLELDTDGIWCIIPSSFPAEVKFRLKNGRNLKIEYPGVILNYMVWKGYTNPQYQTLKDPLRHEYETSTENSIFFEVDGPYKAMILPTSLEEGVNIKKRYAVFELDGSLSELKGFELKRRGELEIVKKLQTGLFAEFLKGGTLQESYAAAAKSADSWLQILENKGQGKADSELLMLISEEKSMSKPLAEYGSQKTTTITASHRIAEFLGEKMIQRKGLNARFIIARYPPNAPVTERAIPVAIFNAPDSTRSHFLRRWLVNGPSENFDLRNIVDWEYYKKRVQTVIQKIITMPAALQDLPNPLPHVKHPPWLEVLLKERTSTKKQQRISGFFQTTDKAAHVEDQKKLIADIEDGFGSNVSHGLRTPKKGTVISKRKLAAAMEEEELVDPNITTSNPPSPHDDYSAWLKFQKTVWAYRRQQHANRQQLFGSQKTRNAFGVKSMMLAQAERAFSNSSWHVLQVTPTATAGQVKAHIWVNGRIQSIKVNVPRTVFVKFSENPLSTLSALPPQIQFEQAHSILPGGETSEFLYRLTMDESFYQVELLNANCIFKNPLVKSVYETQIEAHERFLFEVGTVCKLDDAQPGLLGRGLDSGFELSWLKRPPKSDVEEKTYLQGIPLEFIDVQHYEVNYELFAVLIPSFGSTAHVVHCSGPNQTSEPLKLGSAYQEAQNLLSDETSEEPFFKYRQDVSFTLHTLTDTRKFYAKVTSVLNELQAERATRTLLVVESAQAEKLYKLVRPLTELPSIQLPSAARPLPPVGWQRSLVKQMAKAYFRMQSRMSRLFSTARFAGVPAGNVPKGDIRQLIDIVYARRLLEQRNVLWWSHSPLPDYGGEQQDGLEAAELDYEPPLVNNAGLYAEVCVDISVTNFAVNTILSSNLQSLVDGTESSVTTISGAPLLQNGFSPAALAILSSLVREWWHHVRDDVLDADVFLQHLYAWISSGNSLLYDPRLHYHVENLSKGVFMNLVALIKRRGYSVVMADRSRLVLGTNKSFFANAFSTGRAIIDDIKQVHPIDNPKGDLFKYLDISLQEHWDYLIWLDDLNYGGRVTSSDLSVVGQVVKAEHVSEWQLAEHLPQVFREEFHEWVLQFMQVIGEKKDSVGDRVLAEGAGNLQATKALRSTAANDSADGEYFANGAIDYLSKPLVNRVKQLHRRYLDSLAHDEAAREFEFPVLAGVRPVLLHSAPNPVLELIKDISAVYGLDRNLQREYLWLRKRLLDVVRVGEFEPRAQFVNPFTPMTLHSIICSHCSYVSDINVCQPEAPNSFMWRCPSCRSEFDRVYLEEAIIERFVKDVATYQTQDFKCNKCGHIREDDLALHCKCSGSYVATFQPEEMRQKHAAYQQLAQYYNLRFLHDSIDSYSI